MDAVNLSGYQIAEQVYAGTRTIVYRAIRTSDQYPVVIKLLRNEYPNFHELVGFRNQYTIAKNLDFPSIIKPVSLEAYHNSYALVMEDFGGISLSTYLKTAATDEKQPSNSLSLKKFLNLALQLCDILDYLYQNRVIHKDIKPANILIHPETKQVKLIDFSISSLLPRETQEIQNPNVLEGTLAYLSPEQTGRMNRGIDYRSDFYAVGVTFYQLLTGQLPFVSDDPMELVHCHLAKQPISVHIIQPEIPLVLSQIVSRLMAKNAEDRYQSALGLKHDLKICLDQLRETGKIEYFELGKRDITDRFLIPEKLYGRETEVQTLLDAFDRVSDGNTEMMLVAGFSGIGKTAVVNEVHKPIVRQRGYFIKGKYDQFQRNIPFSAFVQAFRDLMGQLLSESDSQLNIWKSKILEVVGDNGQVLIDVIPELELIIGTQPAATELSGTAAQNRFNLLIQKFVQIFTSPDHPLVMFLDDLQWADSALLKLLQLLMVETRHLLVLGAYRDNEVSPTHPFILTVDEIVKTGAAVNTITLQALSLVDLNQLVADTLNCEFLLAEPLTELVSQKTNGNPFFATQFLKALYEDKLISFDPPQSPLSKGGQGGWQCDIAEVRALAITDDVVEFMALQLQKLPIQTQNTIKLAACIGAQFDLNTLAIVSEKSLEATATDLWKALQESLVIPNTKIYKFFMQSDSASVADAAANPTYRFLHDRIQQAAYSLIGEDRRQVIHYRIGQLMLQKLSESEQNERVFDIVNQLNYGQHLLHREMERTKLAKLNLAAGKKAKSSTAYEAAIDYLNIGISLLGEGAWKNQYDVTFDFYSNLAESQLSNSSFQQLEATIAFALQWIISPADRVKIYILQVTQYTLQAKYQDAIQVGLVGLESLGIVIKKGEISELIRKEFAAVEKKLEHRSIASLLDLPTVIEPAIEAAITLLITIDSPTYITGDFELYVFVSLRATYLSIEHGNVPGSIKAYANYGVLLGLIQQRYQRGYELANLALQLSYKLNSRSMQSKACMLLGGIQAWAKPIAGAADINYEGFLAGVDSGENQFAGYNLLTNIFNRLFQGEHLATVAEDIKKYWLVAQKDQNELLLLALAGANIFITNLCQEQEGQLAETLMTEEELVDRAQTSQSWLSLCLYYILKMHLSCLTGNFEPALYHTTEAGKILSSVAGFTTYSSYSYYSSLILLNLYPTLSDSQQRDALQQVQSNQERLKTWSDSCPENFLHKYLLVEAEHSRLLENNARAIDLYDRAIKGAKEQGYIQEEALANELAAKFYLDWGKEKVAQAYTIEAYYCYSRWGALAKVVDLETRYPQLLQPILEQPKTSFNVLETLTSITHSSTQVDRTGSNISDALDFASVLKAAQALSGIIQLDELLKQLVQIMLQNSGADKCVLVLPLDGTWQVRAISTLEATELCSDSLDDRPDVPLKLIQYVKRTQSVVVINNLQTDLPVIDDYLIERQPKSILCLPILDRGHLAGILYLKNQATVGVFTSSRLTVIEFLCTQAAISLENARLYHQSQQALAELQASESRFQKLADNLPGIIFQFRRDADGSTSTPYVSSGCAELYEVPPSDFINGVTNFMEMEHPDDRLRVLQAAIYAAENFTPLKEEFRIITPRGNLKWVQIASKPERQADGSTISDGVILDVTDRKQAEEEKSRLLAILESTSDLVGIADAAGNNLYLNQAGQQLLQIPAAQTNQFHISEATAPVMLSAMQTEILPTATREGIWSGESIVCSRGGEEIPVSQVIMAHKNAGGEVEFFSTIVRDIRDRKQAEAAIIQKTQELSQALQNLQETQLQMIQSEKMSALGNLVAGIAHEINNPIGFVSGNLNEAQQTVQDLVEHLNLYRDRASETEIADHAVDIDLDYIIEDLPKMIGSMKLGCDRIKGISTSLRTFSRADTDHPVACNIHDGIDSTIMILKHRLKANENRPEIQVVKDYGDLPKVECYAGQLNQVFMNLLANAIDALDESNQGRDYEDIANKITIKTELSLDCKQVIIQIKDNGFGMSQQVRDKIFDELFTTKGVGKGTGLGLAIAQQIVVEKHGGAIDVNSSLGKGTEFAIVLPVCSFK